MGVLFIKVVQREAAGDEAVARRGGAVAKRAAEALALQRLAIQHIGDHVGIAQNQAPDADEHLIHTDLHDTNILAGERGSQDEAKPLQWLAIDPRVVAGDPAFAVAPLLWRRVDTMRGPAELAAHLLTLCAAAELDHARVRAWSLVRCLDYWLWGLSVGLTEDPLRCARVVDWLGWR